MKLPRVLQSSGLRNLLAGQFVSFLGDWMATFAIMAMVLDLTNSPTAVGGVLVLRLVPSGLAGPLATRIAARWDRRRTMLAMDLVRAGMIAAIPFYPVLWWVYLWAFLTEVATVAFLPARDAAIPDLVEHEEDLPAANGLVLVTSYGNIPLGAAAFALIAFLAGNAGGFLATRPHAVALWVDAATYLVSFAFLRRLPPLGRGVPEEAAEEALSGRFMDAFSIPVVRAVLPAATTVFIGVGALFTLGIPYVRDVLGATDVEFGFLVALFGVGGLVGLAAAQKANDRSIEPIRFGVIGLGAVLAGMSLVRILWAAYLGAIGFGATATFALVGATTYLQSSLEGHERVLGFTVFHVLLRTGMSLAAVGAGLAADLIGPVRIGSLTTLEPSATVLFAAGMVVLAGAALLHRPVPTEPREDAADASGDHHR